MGFLRPVSGLQGEQMLVGLRASWLMAVRTKVVPLKEFVQGLARQVVS